MDFITKIKERAKKDKKAIVLPESYEIRNLKAADAALKEGLADIILVGNKQKILEAAPDCDLSKATFIDPDNYDRMDEVVNTLVEIRKSKGITADDARKMLEDPLFFGVMLVKLGVADVIFHLRKKIEQDVNKPQYIKTIRSKGYMLTV